MEDNNGGGDMAKRIAHSYQIHSHLANLRIVAERHFGVFIDYENASEFAKLFG